MKAGHKTHSKAVGQTADRDLDLEIAQNFAEDVEGEEDGSYDAYDSPLKMRAATFETREEARLDREAAELCYFMERLDMSRFLKEIEKGMPEESTDPLKTKEDKQKNGVASNSGRPEGGQLGGLRPTDQPGSLLFDINCTKTADLGISIARPSQARLHLAVLSKKNQENRFQNDLGLIAREGLKPKKQRVLSGILKSSAVK